MSDREHKSLGSKSWLGFVGRKYVMRSTLRVLILTFAGFTTVSCMICFDLDAGRVYSRLVDPAARGRQRSLA